MSRRTKKQSMIEISIRKDKNIISFCLAEDLVTEMNPEILGILLDLFHKAGKTLTKKKDECDIDLEELMLPNN